MGPRVCDSITQVPLGSARGQAVLAASHGGLYSAAYALRAELGAVILHDAGFGRDQAGISGARLLDRWDVPAATVSHRSARIGDGADCAQRGILSFVNEPAARLGLHRDQPARDALALSADAWPPRRPALLSTWRRHGALCATFPALFSPTPIHSSRKPTPMPSSSPARMEACSAGGRKPRSSRRSLQPSTTTPTVARTMQDGRGCPRCRRAASPPLPSAHGARASARRAPRSRRATSPTATSGQGLSAPSRDCRCASSSCASSRRAAARSR